MDALTPTLLRWLADVLLVVHVGIVAFVVLGTVAILVGGWRGWPWVRGLPFRIAHLALMVFIVLQAGLGRLCPLTVWEQALRNRAGQATYSDSFMQHWLSRLIFFDAPWWVFLAAYSAFSALVVASWWWVRPRRKRH